MTTTIDPYARVSLDSDLKMASVHDQLDECKERIVKLGYQVGDDHLDNDKSAWNPKVQRPGWEALMRRLESGKSQGIIVFDLARFSRRPIDGERLITIAEKGLIVLDSENAYDLTTPNGKKTFRDHLSAAAYESDRLSTRVKRGKRRKAMERGGSNHSNRPFGFEQDGETIRPEEAALVREATEWMLNGGSLVGLVREFNRREILTSFGNSWTQMSMRMVLTRERNAGFVVHQGKVVGKMAGTPLIPEDQWLTLTAQFAARRRGRPPAEVYLATGALVCSKCGFRMYGKAESRRSLYADGTPRRRYYCNSTNGGCGRTTADWRGVDKTIEEFVTVALADEQLLIAERLAAKQTSAARAKLDKRVAELEHTALEMAGRLGRNEISLARHDAVMDPLDLMLASLQREQAALPTAAPGTADATPEDLMAQWLTGDMTAKRGLVRWVLGKRMFIVQPGSGSGPRVFNRDRLVVGTWEAPASKLTTRRA